jgi:hypothetical protein
MKRGQSKADANKAIRQEALREQLSAQGHVQHVVDNIKKFEDLRRKIEPQQFARLRAATEFRLKLINKYLPDLKATEISGALDLDSPITAVEITVIGGAVNPMGENAPD